MSCGLAPAISAGTNVVVGNDATYTCNTGYKMDGRPQVHCIGGTWTGTPPTCFLLNAEPTNNYWLDVFNTQDEIPKWLIFLLGTAAGLAALLFACCLLVLCWRSCRGSKVSSQEITDVLETGMSPMSRTAADKRQNMSNEEKVSYTKPTTDKTDDTRDNEEKESENELTNDHHHVETQTKGWAMVREYFHQVEKNCHRQPEMTTPLDSSLPVRDLIVVERRRQKVPSRKIWMPHTHEVRNINTSTK